MTRKNHIPDMIQVNGEVVDLSHFKSKISVKDGLRGKVGNILNATGIAGITATGAAILPGNAKQLIEIRLDDEYNQLLTIALDISPLQPDGAAEIHAFAKIQWGSGGTQHQARMDFAAGTMFTIGGSFVRIIAENAPESDPTVSGQLSASMYLGALQHNGIKPQLTDYITSDLVVGGSQDFNVPPFATGFKFLRNRTAGDFQPTTISVLRNSGLVMYGQNLALGEVMNNNLDINNRARIVRVAAAAGAITQGSLLWQLGI